MERTNGQDGNARTPGRNALIHSHASPYLPHTSLYYPPARKAASACGGSEAVLEYCNKQHATDHK